MQKAGLAGGFFRHRGLIAFSAGGAMAEAALLSFLAPSARPLAAQVTALPPLAAYHDLRWLFAFNQSWLGFTGVLVLLLLARSAVDAVLVLLAWPREAGPASPASPVSPVSPVSLASPVNPVNPVSPSGLSSPLGPSGPGLPRPRFLASLMSCAVLTVLVWLVMSPVVTLMFGVALVPFSWPYLAAVPILLGTALALSQGGVGQSWWRRLPPVRTAAWLLATFAVLSGASVLMTHLDAVATVAVAGLAGVVDARAWYGLTAAAIARSVERPPHPWHWRATLWRIRRALRHRTSWVPVAPLAAVMVLVLVVGVARLSFTGTLQFSTGTSDAVLGPGDLARDGGLTAASAQSSGSGDTSDLKDAGSSGGQAHQPRRVRGAVLVVGGFGSTCCRDASALRAAEPGMLVRQFSYVGLNAAGQPIPYGPAAGNLSIQVLGDRMASQVDKLYQQAHTPVDIVAESEGTLGLYAMLARHPHVHVGSLVLLSPIVEPGQVGQAADSVPGQALITLNDLVGGMSPYGRLGAQALIDSVSEVGASYFAMVSHDTGRPWLAVVPLADAVTLPACPWPPNVIFVDAFHGGLLGNASVQRTVEAFLATGSPDQDSPSQRNMRGEASLIAAAAAAWRMPELHSACPPAG
jgi:hypothetical protein